MEKPVLILAKNEGEKMKKTQFVYSHNQQPQYKSRSSSLGTRLREGTSPYILSKGRREREKEEREKTSRRCGSAAAITI